jgi:hypothetical protein
MYKAFTIAYFIIYILGFIIWAEERRLFSMLEEELMHLNIKVHDPYSLISSLN